MEGTRNEAHGRVANCCVLTIRPVKNFLVTSLTSVYRYVCMSVVANFYSRSTIFGGGAHSREVKDLAVSKDVSSPGGEAESILPLKKSS